MSRQLGHYRYLVLFLAFVPFGQWVLSGEAAEQRQASLAGISASAEPPFLAADSEVQWLFAGISAAIFFTAAMILLDGRQAGARALLTAAAFTATAGIVLLLSVQWIADQSTQEDWPIVCCRILGWAGEI
jgi:hypothetical protein